MDSLPSDVIIEIVKFVYPTELINICLTNGQFAYLGSDERLFRILCTLEFQHFAEDWIFKLAEGWTWKELFIKLFNAKRQMISEMYARVGLTYKYEYRGQYKWGCKYFHYSDIDSSDDLSNMTISERTELKYNFSSPINSSRFSVEPLSFVSDMKYGLTAGDATYRRNLLNIIKRGKSKDMLCSDVWTMKMLVQEGFCIWHEISSKFIILYPMTGLRNIFREYRNLIMKEYTEKFNSACKILNEEIHVSYDCPDLVSKNYAEFQTEIEGIFKDHEWVVITYGYGYKGLSLLVSRYPKSMIFNRDTANDHQMQKFRAWEPQCFNHLNEDLNLIELLDYSTTHKPEIPKIMTLKANGKDGNPITLRLIESETIICQPRISHVKNNDNEFEDPLFGVDDDSTCEYDGPVDSDDSNEL